MFPTTSTACSIVFRYCAFCLNIALYIRAYHSMIVYYTSRLLANIHKDVHCKKNRFSMKPPQNGFVDFKKLPNELKCRKKLILKSTKP